MEDNKEYNDESVCICKRHEVTGSQFSRLIWHEDCPHHGKKNNPWWPELNDVYPPV